MSATSRTAMLTGTALRLDAAGARIGEAADTFIELESVDAAPSASVPRLTIHQAGWLLGDAATQTRDRAVTGNLRALYLEYDAPRVQARLGRQFVVGGAANVAHVDGAWARWLAPLGVEASAFGGRRALPRLAESPAYARLGDRLGGLVARDVTLEPRSSSGYWLAGARVGETQAGWGRAGVSAVEEHEAGDLARRALGFDAALERPGWPSLVADGTYDLAARAWAETRVFALAGPWRGFSLAPSARREDPTLLMSKTSIFSVFASTAYDEAGADAAFERGALRLDAGGYGVRYPAGDSGARARAAATVTAGTRRPVRARVAYERLAAATHGYHAGSAWATVDGLGPVRVSAELWAFLLDDDRTDPRRDRARLSITPQVSAGVRVRGVDVDAALGYHVGGPIRDETYGIVKATVPLEFAPHRPVLRDARGPSAPPPPGDRLIFSHRRHIEANADCEDCHDTARQAGPGTRLPVPEDKCLQCHTEARTDPGCAMCHTEPQAPRARPVRDRGLRFSHRDHVDQRKCVQCHTRAATSADSLEDLAPDMSTCLGCHEHERQFSELACDTCHTRPPAARELPTDPMFSHAGDFRRSHQDVARAKGEVCRTCHDQSFCGDCHEREAPAVPSRLLPDRPDRAAFHRGSFVDRHAVEARADPASCLRCHGRTSCDACHLEAGVSAVARGAVSPHPPGWLVPGPASHGAEARRNLVQCVGCHDQGAASNCVTCHRPGGSGPPPHGPGFTSPLSRTDARVCRACHAGGAS